MLTPVLKSLEQPLSFVVKAQTMDLNRSLQ